MKQLEFDAFIETLDPQSRQLAFEAWQAWTPAEREKATVQDVIGDIEDTLLSLAEMSAKDDIREAKRLDNIIYIDGLPYAVCLPHGGTQKSVEQSEFALLMKGAGEVDMHVDMASWCSNKFVGTLLNEDEGYYWDAAGMVTQYDGKKENWSVDRSDSITYGLGFRPVLVPVDPYAFKPDLGRFADLPDGSLLQFGTLYMNDKAVPNPKDPVASPMPKWTGHPELGFYRGDVPVYEKGAALWIGDTSMDEAEQIRFVVVGGKLVSDRVLLGCVSHDDLEREFHLSKDVTLKKTSDNKKKTQQKEDGPISLWMRLGVSIDVTREELNILREEGDSAQEMLIKLLCSGRCHIDGETYFPEEQKGLEEEIGFDLPRMSFTAQALNKKRVVSNNKSSLSEQIQSASSRTADSVSSVNAPGKAVVSER